MNLSTYIFGSLGSGYLQYPNDYAQTIFRSIYTQSSAPTQIVVHREDKLMYYVYIRRLEASQYIGFCVVLNSVMLTDFYGMFSIFENLITSLVVNGVILQFNDKGDIVSKTNQLYTNQADISHVTDNLRSEFAKLENTSKSLPPVSYSVTKNEKRVFSVSDNIDDIVKASVFYYNTFIFKQKDYDTQSLSSYRGIVRRLNNEKLDITERYQNLQKRYTKVLKQKRQFLLVVFLTFTILGCGIGLLFMNSNLNLTRLELTQANDSIREQEAAIGRLDSTVELQTQTIEKQSSIIKSKNKELKNEKERYTELEGQYANLEERHSNLKDRYSNLESSIVSVAPFVITRVDIGSVYKNGNVETNFGNTLYKSRARYMAPKIYYRGFTSGSYTIKVRWYNLDGTLKTSTSSPSGYSQSYSHYIYTGNNNAQLPGWGWENPGNWHTGTYKMELWCNGRCYFVKSFTVYD